MQAAQVFLLGLLLLLLQPTLNSSSVDAAATPIVDLIVIGDSTAANYTRDPSKFPLSGWAMFLSDHFNQTSPVQVNVRDVAFPGCSSRSFFEKKLWQQAKSTYLSAGDYVFIQFGHNDQKPDPLRHTDPFTTYKHYLSIYINDTRAASATPVLLTPISRAFWKRGALNRTLAGDYPAAMRQLAHQLHVPLIDLNEDTADLFVQLGQQVTQNNLFMCLPPGKFPNYPNGIHDITHLQVEGAKQVATLAARGIAKANLPIHKFLQNLHG